MAVMNYRTQDGRADYGFSIEFRPDKGWRIYIISIRSRTAKTTTRNFPTKPSTTDGVTWTGHRSSQPRRRENNFALWAELAQRYHHTQEEKRFYTEQARRRRRSE
ncbi:MAG: hypothetical protein ACRDSI_08140 [Pseudonocardiaceae bacterium]